MQRGQDQRLIPMVQHVMKDVGIDYDALDRIAVTRGPGSFTGLRIGLAAARGIGLAAGKSVLGIDRFAIHFAQHKQQGRDLLVVLESRRAELFTRYYPAEGEAQPPRLLSVEEISQEYKGALVAGDVYDLLRSSFDLTCLALSLEAEVVSAAALAARANPTDPAFLPRPMYLRPPDVSFPKCQKAE